MRDLPNYAEGQQLCTKLCAHNRIIPRSVAQQFVVIYTVTTKAFSCCERSTRKDAPMLHQTGLFRI